jgi:hypothetical protein
MAGRSRLLFHGLALAALAALAAGLQGCLGLPSATTTGEPLALVSLPDVPDEAAADATDVASERAPSREEAREAAVAEIRAKAETAVERQRGAPYPHVFRTHSPPMRIDVPQLGERQLRAELAQARRELERETDPDEIGRLEDRIAELMRLGRTHAADAEREIEAGRNQ